MELIFDPIFFIFLLLRLLRLVIIIIHSLINFFTSSPNFFIFFLLLVIIIIHSLINFFTSSHPKLNDSSQSHKSLTIHKNGAPSTTMDPKQKKLNESHKSLTIHKNGAPSTTMDPKQLTTKMGKTHPSHPKHKLELKNDKEPYTCDGCKEHGIGKRYRCEPCNYNLHEACMFTSTTPTKSHYLFGKSTFKFYEQHPQKSNNLKTCCDACGKRIKGFVYHCLEIEKDLHPCCSNLKDKLEIEGVKFLLCKNESKCSWCNQKKIKDGWKEIEEWSYVSECGTYNIHVYCVMEMVEEAWKGGTDCLALENLDERSGQSDRKRRRVKKYLRIGKIILETIISVIVGDPITLAIGLVEFFLQN